MDDLPASWEPQSEIVLYQTEDGRSRIEVPLENETVWLTQRGVAELFQATRENITLHLLCIEFKRFVGRMVNFEISPIH